MLTAQMILVYLLQAPNLVGINVDTTHINPEQAYCLAQNIYYESRNEDIQGQYAVASVTLNRANDPRFPNTVCGVVKQKTVSKRTKKLVCAFSWYCEGNKHKQEILVKFSFPASQ